MRKQTQDRFLAVIVGVALAAALTGCVGSGEGGAFTPEDYRALQQATTGFVDTYERVRYPDRPVYPPGAPFPIYPQQQ